MLILNGAAKPRCRTKCCQLQSNTKQYNSVELSSFDLGFLELSSKNIQRSPRSSGTISPLGNTVQCVSQNPALREPAAFFVLKFLTPRARLSRLFIYISRQLQAAKRENMTSCFAHAFRASFSRPSNPHCEGNNDPSSQLANETFTFVNLMLRPYQSHVQLLQFCLYFRSL